MSTWFPPVLLLSAFLLLGFSYHMGFQAGKTTLVVYEWEQGYHRCLFIWKEAILKSDKKHQDVDYIKENFKGHLIP